MSPPRKNENGPQGCNPETRNETNADQTQALHVTVQPGTDVRHAPVQTPIARFLLVHEHRPGRRTSDAIPLDHCPVCGFQSTHKTEWPPLETLWKSCTSCGYRDQFATIAVKAGSRTRRAAR